MLSNYIYKPDTKWIKQQFFLIWHRPKKVDHCHSQICKNITSIIKYINCVETIPRPIDDCI